MGAGGQTRLLRHPVCVLRAAAGFVGYGSLGGTRAVEYLRGMTAEMQIAGVREQVNFLLASDFENYSEFTPGAHQAEQAQKMFDQLKRWTGALKTLRA